MKLTITTFSITVIFLLSCRDHSPEHNINIIKHDISQYSETLNKINKWVETQPPLYPLYLFTYRKEYIEITSEYKVNRAISNKLKTEIFILLTKSNFYKVTIHEDIIVYVHNSQNEYRKVNELIYIRDITTQRFSKYKKYKTGEIPQEKGGWFYHIGGRWYLWSPKDHKYFGN